MTEAHIAPSQLDLFFPDPHHVVVRFEDEPTQAHPFAAPFVAEDRFALRWYVETYGAFSLGEPDDAEADRIVARLPELGYLLFRSVFAADDALRLFRCFRETRDRDRVLTITATHPQILSLPWELLHNSSSGGTFLFQDDPPISIHRTIPFADCSSHQVTLKERLHLLFVVSRPRNAAFLDPRADPEAVLDALDENAPGRVACEFLRPATLDALARRLTDTSRPAVDVVHFDGHGVFWSAPSATGSPPNLLPSGYLLFETLSGDGDLVSAERFGQSLRRHRIPLVILSACQSAEMADADGADAMGSVAARLLAAGVPAVLAMAYSVLVPTTRQLFGAFYESLAAPSSLGKALDHARRHLAAHPQRYRLQRGGEHWLCLQDWFLPVLYQSGTDRPLLTAVSSNTPAGVLRTNLPPRPREGFFGRSLEIWRIERSLALGVRRVTVSGFGGQGKTQLACEAGRWLLRAGLFDAAVLVDYSRVQTLDAASVAVSTIATVLEQNLADADAATRALQRTPTLVILDNLELLPAVSRTELLAVAAAWSQAGGSRVLCTARLTELGHPLFSDGAPSHLRIALTGLGDRAHPDDALAWLAAISQLRTTSPTPPAKRADLLDLLEEVRFHPLSIRILAPQLVTYTTTDLRQALRELLAAADPQIPEDAEFAPSFLRASLRLSLSGFTHAARGVVIRLGVFQGGAFEDAILLVLQVPEAIWHPIRDVLLAAFLIEKEAIAGQDRAFFRFHPSLAPALWAEIDSPEKERLLLRHRQRYLKLAGALYNEDSFNPTLARGIARLELPNLLFAARGALAAQDEEAVDFADSLIRFLRFFGLTKDADDLLARANAMGALPGTEPWFLTQMALGAQQREQGNFDAAEETFRNVLSTLPGPSGDHHAQVLLNLSHCLQMAGKAHMAARQAEDALVIIASLPPSDRATSLRAHALVALADALVDQGQLAEAEESYNLALHLAETALNEPRRQAVIRGRLGNLRIEQGRLDEARSYHKEALGVFGQLGERSSTASALAQLGRIAQEARQWEDAEGYYRQAALIHEELNDIVAAAGCWLQLANIAGTAGHLGSVEEWSRKALSVFRRQGHSLHAAKALNNIAALLVHKFDRPGEALELAETALAIMLPLDGNATQIWKTHDVLATATGSLAAAPAIEESTRASLRHKAREYRRAARDARRAYPGTSRDLEPLAPIISVAVQAVSNPDLRVATEAIFRAHSDNPKTTQIATACLRILAGERDAEALCESVECLTALAIEAILAAIIPSHGAAP